ncbi:hypothetical protein ACH5RR_008536 [Cinchona calisaya]|uniref:Bromo domain-containing protein n=1 Tax=Cinchona calisaya TaxID=153742 RepID=A0ABD3ABV4_9GENT
MASNGYFTFEEFARDVKLTLSNLMRYNPTDDDVHVMAMQLHYIFIRRWKLLDDKLKIMTTSAQQGMISSGSENTAQDKMKACSNKSQDRTSSGIKKNSQCKKSSVRSWALLLVWWQRACYMGREWELSFRLGMRPWIAVASCQLTDGSRSDLHEESTCPNSGLSTTVTTAISAECQTTSIDDKQTLKRALRAAMLKSRFAETVAKANGDKAGVRERMNRLQGEAEVFRARIREKQWKKDAELKRRKKEKLPGLHYK